MSDFSLSIHLSSEIKERLDYVAQRIGVPREAIVEFAVEEILEDLDFEESAQGERPPKS